MDLIKERDQIIMKSKELSRMILSKERDRTTEPDLTKQYVFSRTTDPDLTKQYVFNNIMSKNGSLVENNDNETENFHSKTPRKLNIKFCLNKKYSNREN